MFEIVFLGTSAAAPSIHRGMPAQMVIARENRFLVDCGEGTQRQILKSGVGFRRMNRILLTHGHLDHILGLGGLLSTIANWEEGIEYLEIYGGASTLERVHYLVFGVALRGFVPPMSITLHELSPHMVIFEDKHMQISAFPVIHRGSDNFGFIFQQHEHRPFLEEKATALGIPAGPERASLVRGENITLADGRVVTPEDVLGPPILGSKYVHIGDIAVLDDDIYATVAHADCLVIEATYLDEEVDIARSVGHITAGEAARMAAETGVKTLILTHISRRNSERAIRDEACHYFANTYVARDFDRFRISRGHPVQKLTPNGN
ncbi:MAG: ribonuclease Z [Phototrophicales bacterium]|nr:MAG: ribonuclease Z [Phototrophicales bacterium]